MSFAPAGTFVLRTCPVRPYATAAWRRGVVDQGHGPRLEEVKPVKTWLMLGSAAAVTTVGLALLAGKGDIRRLWRMHNM